MNSEIKKILPTISKPTRYLGDELNAVRKSLDIPDLVRFALAFPDIYDVGMSHLGFKILYQILNSKDDVWAERVYSPWIDMEAAMRDKGIPIFSLESASSLMDFDIVGFSLQYEMSYTNVLNMLELAQIPLLAKDRDSDASERRYPLVIAGGPCAFNPEPMADFIDFFVIGDGEEVVIEVVECYKAHRDGTRQELLSKIAEIPGIYVPSLASVEEQADGMLAVVGDPVQKRVVEDLDGASYPVDYLLPFMKPIHDRVVIEVMRGCTRGCRFCQAGMIYRPLRERSPDVVECLAAETIKNTGYDELSLSSLSTCDHSSIQEIVKRLAESPGRDKHVAISLPSLRADSFSIELAQELTSIGKTGLTFAPEVATEKMQNVVNKSISKADVFSAVKGAFAAGWNSLKLYFMIGLPTETEEDIAEIARFVNQALNVAVNANRRASLNVSVSTFVPKAHTPFQWERQLSIDEVREKQELLRGKIGRNRRLNVSFHSPEVSLLEGVFARGDRRLGKVLHAAHQLGCKLDGWTECFNYDGWVQAFDQSHIDPEIYLKARKIDQKTPWDHIDAFVTKDFLLNERNKAYKLELTPDCRWGDCEGCGVRDMLNGECPEIRRPEIENPVFDSEQPVYSSEHPVSKNSEPVMKIRFQFAKQEAVKFISHLDLISTFIRAFKRAEVPVAYSHGFNPHPKFSLGTGLPVGTTSEAEFADVELEVFMEVDDFISRTNAQLPEGVKILKVQEIPLKERPLMAHISLASYIVRIPEMEADVDSQIRSILDMEHIWIERAQKNRGRSGKRAKSQSSGTRFVDIKPLVRDIGSPKSVEGMYQIEMLLGDGKNGKVRPEEVIRLILDDLAVDIDQKTMLSTIEIHKTGSFIEDQEQIFAPMESVPSSMRD